MNDLKRKLSATISKAEEGQTYAYGGGGLLLAVLVIVLLVILLR